MPGHARNVCGSREYHLWLTKWQEFQVSTFSQRWRVPEPARAIAEWTENLDVIGDSCLCPDSYHLLWGGLRIAKQNVGLYWEAEQLRVLLEQPLSAARDVLIVGSADQMVLALLNDIGSGGQDRSYLLIDRCPAPLKVAESYAKSQRLRLATCDWDLATPFPQACSADLVFLHYTLDFMTTSTRERVLANLASVLSEDGQIIIAHRTLSQAKREANPEVWANHVLAALPVEVKQNPRWQGNLERLLLAYADARAARAIDEIGSDTLLAQIAQAGLLVLSAHPTVRGQMVKGSRDPIRASEQSTIYILGQNRPAGT